MCASAVLLLSSTDLWSPHSEGLQAALAVLHSRVELHCLLSWYALVCGANGCEVLHAVYANKGREHAGGDTLHSAPDVCWVMGMAAPCCIHLVTMLRPLGLLPAHGKLLCCCHFSSCFCSTLRAVMSVIPAEITILSYLRYELAADLDGRRRQWRAPTCRGTASGSSAG